MFNKITFLYSFSSFFLSLFSSVVSPLGLILKMLKVDFLLSAMDCGPFGALFSKSN